MGDGDETVFESDGVAFDSSAPELTGEAREAPAVALAEVDETAPTSQAAFEVFMGKGYGASSGLVPLDAITGPVTATSPAARPSSLETPSERLARLQEEVADLQKDLSVLANVNAGAASSGDGAREDSAPRPDLYWGAMSKAVDELQSQLASMAVEPSFATFLPSASGASVAGAAPSRAQAQVFEQLAQRLAAMQAAGGAVSVEGRSSGLQAQEPSAAEGDGVTYEVFVAGAAQAGSAAAGERIQALEARLAAMEAAVGSSAAIVPEVDVALAALVARGGSSSGGGGLLHAVAALEQRVSRLDPGALEALQGQAAAARAELQALAKERDRSIASSRYGQAPAAAAAAEACATLRRWDATATALPAVVQRLESLQALHRDAATVAARLAAVEEGQETLRSLLLEAQQALRETGATAAENAAVISDNVAATESRMAALSAASARV